jgi:prepilin-type N-terminal cleavage/methylation domain-containing protein
VKKGFTLIELIIAIALASVLLTISSRVIMTSIQLYKNETELNRNMLYLKEAAMYIESQLQNDTKSVELNENKLVIHKFDEKRGEVIVTIRKDIFLNTFEKLVVVDYEDNISKGAPNNIMAKVKGFICSKEGNLIYIAIESKNGDKIERCIEINTLG